MARRKIEKEPTREERLQTFLKEGYGNYRPQPTYSFQVGDFVHLGSLQDVVVCDVIGDGVYEVDYTKTDNNYGKPIIHPHQRRFVWWHQIRPINNSEVSFVKNDDLRLSFFSETIECLLHKALYFGIDFTPEYQRDYVWELSDKVALIDSIFNNIDIGKFVFIHNKYGTNDNTYTVLDGKQRTNAILEFYENRFPYNGCYYNDLSWRDKAHFENYHISVAEVDEMSESQILRYFISLNTSGKSMDAEHIAKVKTLYDNIKDV